MNYNKKELLHSLSTIMSSVKMTEEFRKTFGTDFKMVKACIEEDFIKDDAVSLIKRIAPICYKINGKVFLKGEVKGKHDFIGDDMDFQSATELYDMTREFETNESYSFYVSTTEHFSLATEEEIIEVQDFLKGMNN